MTNAPEGCHHLNSEINVMWNRFLVQRWPPAFPRLLLLMIHTFSVLSLQLKKLRWHNQSAIDISNDNPARGHKQVRRSRGYIMVTTRYSNQQGSKSRQNFCQAQPTEDVIHLSPPRRCMWVRTILVSMVCRALNSELHATEKY